jgi:hypothetical protein
MHQRLQYRIKIDINTEARAADIDEQRLRALRADVDADHVIHVCLPLAIFQPIVKGNWLPHLRSMAVTLTIRVIPDPPSPMELVHRKATAMRTDGAIGCDAARKLRRIAGQRTMRGALTFVHANTIIRPSKEQMLT